VADQGNPPPPFDLLSCWQKEIRILNKPLASSKVCSDAHQLGNLPVHGRGYSLLLPGSIREMRNHHSRSAFMEQHWQLRPYLDAREGKERLPVRRQPILLTRRLSHGLFLVLEFEAWHHQRHPQDFPISAKEEGLVQSLSSGTCPCDCVLRAWISPRSQRIRPPQSKGMTATRNPDRPGLVDKNLPVSWSRTNQSSQVPGRVMIVDHVSASGKISGNSVD